MNGEVARNTASAPATASSPNPPRARTAPGPAGAPPASARRPHATQKSGRVISRAGYLAPAASPVSTDAATSFPGPPEARNASIRSSAAMASAVITVSAKIEREASSSVGENATRVAARSPVPRRTRSPISAAHTIVTRSEAIPRSRPTTTIGVGSRW